MRERGNTKLRWIDRRVAPVVVAGLAATRRARPLPVRPASIAVMKSAAMGDMVLMSAVASDLRRAYPEVRLIAFGGRDNAAIARLMPEWDEVVEIRAAEPWSVVRQLRRHRVDLLLDFGPWTRTEAIYARLAGARAAVGFDTPGADRHRAYDLAVAHSAECHELENYRSILRAVGVEAFSEPHLVPVGRPPAVLDGLGDYAVLHPWPGGFGSQFREWPIERWEQLAAELAGEGHRLVVTGGAADAGRTRDLVARLGAVDTVARLGAVDTVARLGAVETAGRLGVGVGVVDTAGQLSLGELSHLLRASRVVVSVNTGVMHLAAALGAATVGLNGPTADRRWGPRGARVRSVNSPLPGCGYLHLGFEYEGRRTDCMLAITVPMVMEAVRDLAGEKAA